MPMSSSPAVAVAVASAAVVALAVANRVLYKLALVPLKSYPFLLAQLTTFGYVTVYFSILYARYRAGVVTRDMLTLPKIRFAVIGLLEALGVAAGMSAGAMLPGPAIPILSQGKRPDIFVVNSFGSGFQALVVFLLLPLLSNLRGIKLAELSGHLNGGAECFLNVGESPIDCGGAPFLPLLFIFVNMAFNISLLNLVKMSSAVVASLTATSAVPISIYILSLPLPYIPQGAELSASFIFGGIVLLMGLILYNLPQSSKESKTD
ncbi:hypothetical protein VPH35_082061 [Triticum aestivum]